MTMHTKNSAVHSPKHYKSPDLELIDYLEAGAMCLHLGSAVQYVTRFPFKGCAKQDLEKALWYLKRLRGCHGVMLQQCFSFNSENFLRDYHHDRIVEAFFSERRLNQFGIIEDQLPQDFRNFLRSFYWQVNMACCAEGEKFLIGNINAMIEAIETLKQKRMHV